MAPATKRGAFPRPPGRLYGFRRRRRHKKWRRRRHTSPAQRYYIPPEGGSPQPVREASADPGQNPGSPGPKGPSAGSTLTPVRACQPSGILESTAPPTGIYREMIHYRRIPRSFVSLRMTSGRRGSPATSRQPPATSNPHAPKGRVTYVPYIPVLSEYNLYSSSLW